MPTRPWQTVLDEIRGTDVVSSSPHVLRPARPAKWEADMPNKPNFPHLRPKNADRAQKQSQSVWPGWPQLRISDCGLRIRACPGRTGPMGCAPNEPNFGIFGLEMGVRRMKQTQSKPISSRLRPSNREARPLPRIAGKSPSTKQRAVAIIPDSLRTQIEAPCRTHGWGIAGVNTSVPRKE